MKLRGKAFTLVELLVVMGMIAVLIAIILPALRRVREQSDDARCKANLRELFVAQTFYSDDNQKQYAGVEYRADALWPDRLKKYVTRTAQFPRRLEHCPTGNSSLPRLSIQRTMPSATQDAREIRRRNGPSGSSDTFPAADNSPLDCSTAQQSRPKRFRPHPRART
jgi:prepilin-type N-terminal cleavage/methylation domain-containing protein